MGTPVEIKGKDGFGHLANVILPHETTWIELHTPALGVNAAITKAGETGKSHYITFLFAQCDEDGWSVVLKDGTVNLINPRDKTAGMFIVFPSPIKITTGNSVTWKYTGGPNSGYQIVMMGGYTE